MNAERWKQVEALFESALECEPAERAAFLDQACGDDVALRKEVESLLAHQQPTGQFISTLVHDVVKLFPPPSPAERDARFIPGTVLANRYRIIGLLGRGGMGEVYRADDLKLGQPVALKFLPENVAIDGAMLGRFHREVRVARQISHPNVCRVFDIGEINGQHFLTMEYIDGEDLSSLLRRIGRLPADKAVEIARQLCAGLAAAHEQGVLHRDLKPANVMIDGRGKARITDFGLAGLADEFQGHDVRAGTPAYMAPEQLAGREVTTRSDIYALGLVLYEIFTGKKAFEAATLEELIRQHESSAPPSISDYVKEVDPLVERVILRCLSRDPQSRPTTVTQVAAALPGSDPLAAALAAGETPSPEMVAAAPREGALRPAVATLCLVVFFAELAAVMWLSGLALHNVTPLEKSPEVLTDRARSVASKMGYAAVADTAYGIAADPAPYQYVIRQVPASDERDQLARRQPVYALWYRQSPRPIQALGDYGVSLTDPPLDVPGMANVTLDMSGRLIEFNAVPPQLETGAPPPAAVDWAALFAEAGYDPARFARSAPEWTPPVYADTRAAWTSLQPEHTELPIRIEAAAYRGQPVYFQVIAPWTTAERQAPQPSRRGRRAAEAILTVLLFAGLIAAVWLARHNLRMGRGDRRGAFKVALVGFTATLVGMICGAHHVSALGGEMLLLAKITGWALSIAVFIWLVYVALEPYVRRRWPRLLISWSRLLAGGFRDPMVGRDILIGSLLGFGHALTIYMMFLLTQGTKNPKLFLGVDGVFLQGPRTIIMLLLSDSLVGWITMGLALLFLLLLLVILLRRQWLATLVMWVLFVAIDGLAFIAHGERAVLWLGPVVIATLGIIAIARFGLLTTIAFQAFFNMTFHYVMTPNWSSWYAQNMFITLAVVVALALYSFYVSLAGQPLFRNALLHD